MDQNEHADAVQGRSDLARRRCFATDDGDVSDIAVLFGEQGVFETNGLSVRGRQTILAMIRSRSAGVVMRHHLTTSRIEVLAPGEVMGRRSCLVCASGARHDPKPARSANIATDMRGKRDDGYQPSARRHAILVNHPQSLAAWTA